MLLLLQNQKLSINEMVKTTLKPPIIQNQYSDREILADFQDSCFYCAFEKKEMILKNEFLDLSKAFQMGKNPVCIVGPPGSGKSTLISRFLTENAQDCFVIWIDARKKHVAYNQMKMFCKNRYNNAIFLQKQNVLMSFYERVIQIARNKKVILVIDNANKATRIKNFIPMLENEPKNLQIVLSSQIEPSEIYCIFMVPFTKNDILKIVDSKLLLSAVANDKDEIFRICGVNSHAASQLSSLLALNSKVTLSSIIQLFNKFEANFPIPFEENYSVHVKLLMLTFKTYENIPEIQYILTIMCLLNAYHISRCLLENMLKKSLKLIIQKMENLNLIRLNNHEQCQIIYGFSLIHKSMNYIIKMFGYYGEWDEFLIRYFSLKKNIFLGDGIPSRNLPQFKHYLFQHRIIDSLLKQKKTSLLLDISNKLNMGSKKMYSNEKNKFELNIPIFIFFCFKKEVVEAKVLMLIEAAKKIYGEKSLNFLITQFFLCCIDTYPHKMKCDINQIFQKIAKCYDTNSDEFKILKQLHDSLKKEDAAKLTFIFTILIQQLSKNKSLTLVKFIVLLFFIIRSSNFIKLSESLFNQINLLLPTKENLIIKLYFLAMQYHLGLQAKHLDYLQNLIKEDRKINKCETFVSFFAGIIGLQFYQTPNTKTTLVEFLAVVTKSGEIYKNSLCGFEGFIYLVVAKAYAYLNINVISFDVLKKLEQLCDTKNSRILILKYEIFMEGAKLYLAAEKPQDEVSCYLNALGVLEKYKNSYNLNNELEEINYLLIICYLKMKDTEKYKAIFEKYLQFLNLPKKYVKELKTRLNQINTIITMIEPHQHEWSILIEIELNCYRLLDEKKYLNILLNYAITFSKNGFHQKAVDKFNYFIEKTLAKIEYDSMSMLKCLTCISKSLYYLGRLKEAISHLKNVKKYLSGLSNQTKTDILVERYTILVLINQVYSKQASLLYIGKILKLIKSNNPVYIDQLYLKNTILIQLKKYSEVGYVDCDEKQVADNTIIYRATFLYFLKESNTAKKLLEISIKKFSEDNHQQIKFYLQAGDLLSKIIMDEENYGLALKTWIMTDTKCQTLSQEYPILFYEHYRVGGLIELKNGNVDRSEILLNQSLAFIQKIPSTDCLDLGEILLNLGQVYVIKKDYINAKKKLEESNQIYQTLFPTGCEEIQEIQNLLQKIPQ